LEFFPCLQDLSQGTLRGREALLGQNKNQNIIPQPFPFYNILANIDLNLDAAMATRLSGNLPVVLNYNFLNQKN